MQAIFIPRSNGLRGKQPCQNVLIINIVVILVNKKLYIEIMFKGD